MSRRLRLLFQCLVVIPLITADEHNHIVSEFYAVSPCLANLPCYAMGRLLLDVTGDFLKTSWFLEYRPCFKLLVGFLLVEMFNCIVDTVEDSSSVRSYRKFLIANFFYKYIHKTIKLTEHYNT